MHGLIMMELKKYVDTRLGKEAWANLLKESGISSRVFLATEEYPDQEVVALVTTASKMTGKSPLEILEDFGEFLVPDLIAMYRPLIKPEWRTLDFLENTEGAIHTAVRARNPGAKPPELRTSRPSPDEVVITYSSARKMCALARGMAKGVANHYGERIVVTETSCMLKGSPMCKISVRLVR